MFEHEKYIIIDSRNELPITEMNDTPEGSWYHGLLYFDFAAGAQRYIETVPASDAERAAWVVKKARIKVEILE